jgi:hypothetical protein
LRCSVASALRYPPPFLSLMRNTVATIIACRFAH